MSDSARPKSSGDELSAAEVDADLPVVLTAGETINGATLPVAVYMDDTDNEVKACDGNDTDKIDFLGFAISNSTDGNSITIQHHGVVGGFSGLDTGKRYYVQDDKTIGTSEGTYPIFVGIAVSATQIRIMKEELPNVTANQQYLLPTPVYNYITVTVDFGANDTVYVFPINIPYDMPITDFSFEIGSPGAGGGKKLGVGIYSLDGNTKIMDVTYTTTPGGTGMQTQSLASQEYLRKGNYLLAWSTDDNSLKLGGFDSINLLNSLQNGANTYIGSAANSSASGVLPATLGVISSANIDIPAILLSN